MHDNEASHIMFIKLLLGQEFKKPLRHDIPSQVHFIQVYSKVYIIQKLHLYCILMVPGGKYCREIG